MTLGCPMVVLAAGESRRMGRPKALLDLGGRAAIEVVVGACLEAGCPEVIVVLGADSDAVRDRVPSAPGVQVVVNQAWRQGQTSSVKEGVGRLTPSSAFMVHPVDHPLVEPATIRALAARFASRAAGRTILVPTFEGRRGHPVVFAAEIREAVLDLPDGTPLHDFVRARADQVEHLPTADRGVASGMNDEAEYRAVLEEIRRRGTDRAR